MPQQLVRQAQQTQFSIRQGQLSYAKSTITVEDNRLAHLAIIRLLLGGEQDRSVEGDMGLLEQCLFMGTKKIENGERIFGVEKMTFLRVVNHNSSYFLFRQLCLRQPDPVITGA